MNLASLVISMTDEEFDRAVIAALFAAAARNGWRSASVAASARDAGLDMARAHTRLPTRNAVLRRFGAMADSAALTALADTTAAANLHERLFDMLMRRIDTLQSHRAGVLALFNGLPSDPSAALMLAGESLASMEWLLDAAGESALGPLGALRAHGLLAVWLWTIRTWRNDGSIDLSATMAALDAALARAAQAARSLPWRRTESGLAGSEPFDGPIAASTIDPLEE